MMDNGPFHSGELAVQERLGVREEIGPWASKVVRPFLPDQHRAFYGQLPFLVAAARDQQGRPWATLLTGPPGFTRTPDSRHLLIDARPLPGDALEGQLVPGVELGLLGIELATRRRNRVNGRIEGVGAQGLLLEVGQAFGNCPQNIREREWQWAAPAAEPPSAVRSPILTERMRARISAADTFFIASGHRGEGEAAAYGMDASHRGGSSGFVRVEGESRLVFPDYAGNNHFNTIGNLVADARAGLLFLDFERGGMLQLTGRTTIDWDSPALAEHPGARRLVIFELDSAVELPGVLPIRWTSRDSSVRSLRIVDKRRESRDVVSFTLAAGEGGVLPEFEPGQHLPIELEIPALRERVRRTYSLSNAPGEGVYRITVKREPLGVASRFLHDQVDVGARVSAGTPAGDFVLAPGSRPVVLVSAGVGVTPMVGMLRDLVARKDERSVLFVHAARDGEHHALGHEVRALAEARESITSHVFYSRAVAGEGHGRPSDHAGRLDAERLAALMPGTDVDVYLCGPVSFMTEIRAGLEARGVSPERIHSEQFGPRG